MAIPDFLWACPECGEDRGLIRDRTGFRCRTCATRFRRVQGASIRAERPDGSSVIRRPREWLARLPEPADLLRERADDQPLRSARVTTRWVTGTDTVRGREGYLNRIELWGDEEQGTLEIRPDSLVYAPDGETPIRWPLQSIVAVQASSSSLQINRSDEPLVAFRFTDDSIRLWEELLHAALRDFYGRTGRGEIVEFQPRITTA